MKRILALIVSLVLLGTLFVGCQSKSTGGQGGDKKAKTIAFLFQDLETEFWVAGHKAISTTLKDAGMNVVERNCNKDANKQLEQAKDVIAQKVDAIMMIPADGDVAVTIGKLCNDAGVPLGVFNRPPTNKDAKSLVVVANNESIAKQAVEHLATEAKKIGGKVTPLIIVGDLGDPNAIGRKKGFYDVIDANPDLFNKAIEVPTGKWDDPTCLANLKSAMQANPDVGLIFTSSDKFYPQIKAVLEPLGKWKKMGEKGHILLGGLDGDSTAGRLMDEGFVDSTGVQDLYFEAKALLDAVIKAVNNGDKTPMEWIDDPGFALTQANMKDRKMDMWGNKIRQDKGELK